MTTTMINTQGHILNTAERAISYINNVLEGGHVSSFSRFRFESLRDALWVMYAEASSGNEFALGWLRDEISYHQDVTAFLRDM